MAEQQNIRLRLLASVKYDAVNGDERERNVCASQMKEAAERIAALESELAALRGKVRDAINFLRVEHYPNFSDGTPAFWPYELEALRRAAQEGK